MAEYAGQFDDQGTKPYVVDIEKATLDNTTFRTTMWTGEKLQLTVMEIPVGECIGLKSTTASISSCASKQAKGCARWGRRKTI